MFFAIQHLINVQFMLRGEGFTVLDPIFRIKLHNFPKTLQVCIIYHIVTLVTDFQNQIVFFFIFYFYLVATVEMLNSSPN